MDALVNLMLITPFALVTIPVAFGVLMVAVHLWSNRGRY